MNKNGLFDWVPSKDAKSFFGLDRKKEPVRFQYFPTKVDLIINWFKKLFWK